MLVKPTIIKFSGIEYVNCDYVMENAPIYAKGARNTRSLIKNKKIPSDQYMFAKKNGEVKWIRSDGKSIKLDKILLKKEYLVNIPELQDNNKDIVSDDGTTKAPEIIVLNDNEKFKDDQDNVVKIETRGVREYDGIYFKVKDVSIAFNLPKLQSTVIDDRSGYKDNQHYKYFNCTKNEVSANSVKKIVVIKELFLTYVGILRVLFATQSGKTNNFIKWATETLFTVQMGTENQKNKLISDIKGIPAQSVKEVFSASANSYPCVYLFSLGFAKDLRQSMNIDPKYADNMLVCKYGYTQDLTRRTGEHMKSFGNIKNVELKMKYYSHVDPMYCSQAETDIRNYFKSLEIELKYKDYEELVIIKPEFIKMTETQYKQISEGYGGHIKDMIKRVEDLKKEKELLIKDNELKIANAKIIMLEKDNKINILEKDLEIEKLRNQLSNKK